MLTFLWFTFAVLQVMRKQVNYHPHNSVYGPYAGMVRPLFVYQVEWLLGRKQNFEIGSRDLGHADFAVVLWAVCREGPSSVCSKFIRLLGGKFRNWVMWPRPRPLRGRFMVRTQGGSVLYVCTNFQVNGFFVQKLLGSHNFVIGSRHRKPRPFWTWNVEFV